MNNCPYCDGIGPTTREHIFSESMGGRRTIAACQSCNNSFGWAFEGPTHNNFILPQAGILAAVGLNLPTISGRWRPKTTSPHQDVYDLELHDGRLTTKLRPKIISRNGPLFTIKTEATEEGRRDGTNMLGRNRFKLTDIGEVSPPELQKFSLQIGDTEQMRRTCLKIGIAVLAAEWPELLPFCRAARKSLCALTGVVPNHFAMVDLRLQLPNPVIECSLCHTVYLEARHNRLLGFVTFYNSFRFWICLSNEIPQTLRKAVFARLNPLTGEECFKELPESLKLFEVRWDGLIDPFIPFRRLHHDVKALGGDLDAISPLKEIMSGSYPFQIGLGFTSTSTLLPSAGLLRPEDKLIGE